MLVRLRSTWEFEEATAPNRSLATAELKVADSLDFVEPKPEEWLSDFSFSSELGRDFANETMCVLERGKILADI